MATGAGGLWDGAVKGVQDVGKGVQDFSGQALNATGEFTSIGGAGRSSFGHALLLLAGSCEESLVARMKYTTASVGLPNRLSAVFRHTAKCRS